MRFVLRAFFFFLFLTACRLHFARDNLLMELILVNEILFRAPRTLSVRKYLAFGDSVECKYLMSSIKIIFGFVWKSRVCMYVFFFLYIFFCLLPLLYAHSKFINSDVVEWGDHQRYIRRGNLWTGDYLNKLSSRYLHNVKTYDVIFHIFNPSCVESYRQLFPFSLGEVSGIDLFYFIFELMKYIAFRLRKFSNTSYIIHICISVFARANVSPWSLYIYILQRVYMDLIVGFAEIFLYCLLQLCCAPPIYQMVHVFCWIGDILPIQYCLLLSSHIYCWLIYIFRNLQWENPLPCFWSRLSRNVFLYRRWYIYERASFLYIHLNLKCRSKRLWRGL